MGKSVMLPKVAAPLDKLNIAQLRFLVPSILKSTTGRVSGIYGDNAFRPVWWPPKIPWCNPRKDLRKRNAKGTWSSCLRKVVESCYHYYGKQKMIPGNDNPKRGLQKVTKGAVRKTLKVKCESRRVQKKPKPIAARKSPKNEVHEPETKEHPFVEIFVCFHCEKKFSGNEALLSHRRNCILNPPQLKRVETAPTIHFWNSGPPTLVPAVRPLWCTNPLNVDKVERPPLKEFASHLNLVGRKERAMLMKKKPVISCPDLHLDDDVMPPLLITPPSKKCILNKDLTPGSCSKRLFLYSSGQQDPESDGESVCSKSSDKDEKPRYNRSTTNRLFRIDLTSQLGQRIQPYLENRKDKDAMSDISDKESNYEKYCRTPKKSSGFGRLRNRNLTEFPVTYRQTNETARKHCHKMKFTKNQKREFECVLKTGLNARARKLKQTTKPCWVQLERLNREGCKCKVLYGNKMSNIAKEQETSYKYKVENNPSTIRYEYIREILNLKSQQGPSYARDESLRKRNYSLKTPEIMTNSINDNDDDPALTPPNTPPEQESPCCAFCAKTDHCTNCMDKRDIAADFTSYYQNSPHGDYRNTTGYSQRIDPIVALQPLSFYGNYNGKFQNNNQRHDNSLKENSEIKFKPLKGGNSMIKIEKEQNTKRRKYSTSRKRSSKRYNNCDQNNMDGSKTDVMNTATEDSDEEIIFTKRSSKNKNSFETCKSDSKSKNGLSLQNISAVQFKCHLCSLELRADLNKKKNLISEHYMLNHGLPNVGLQEEIDEDGNTAGMSVVMDIGAGKGSYTSKV